MLENLIARYRAWDLKQSTIRMLEHCTDRQLADMGIKRAQIVAIASRGGKLNQVTRHKRTIQTQMSRPHGAAHS